MAIYGNTLDSLMANRVAQQAADLAETNSYRNYLAQMANTNIKKNEQESNDRYRQGELGVRGQDVAGMNKYREGQIDIGKLAEAARAADVASLTDYRRGQIDIGKLGEQNRATDISGMNDYRKGQIDIGRTAEQNRAADITGMNKYREGQIDLGKLGEQNRATDISGMNRYREGQIDIGRLSEGTRAADVSGNNMYRMGSLQNTLEVAKLNADVQRYLADKQASAYENQMKLQLAAAARPDPTLAQLRLSDELEQRKADKTAYAALLQDLADKYKYQTSGFFSGFKWNSPATEEILDLLDNKKAVNEDDAIRQIAEKRFKAMYPSNALFRQQVQSVNPYAENQGGTNRPPINGFLVR